MHMKNIEIKPGHHFGHFGGKNEIVGRVFEERISKNFDFMKVNPVSHRQSNGKCVTYEVNVMTTQGKFFPEFSGNHAAAAIRRIAGDPDLHISTTWCSFESSVSSS